MQIKQLTKDQESVLNKFRQYVNNQKFDDQYLLRFLKARQFNEEKTKEMWKNFIQWRQKNDIENIKNYEFHEIDKVRQLYPHGYYQCDKTGRPIYIERLGLIVVQELWKVTNEDRLIKYLAQNYEFLLNDIFPYVSKLQKKNINQNIVIFDLKGISLSMVPQVKQFLQMAIQLGQNNYPEILGQMFIINAPFFFKGVWNIIKKFLNENSSYYDKLSQIIDEENIPQFLGGKGNCDLSKNTGPWNQQGLELYGSQKDIQEKNKIIIQSQQLYNLDNQQIQLNSQDNNINQIIQQIIQQNFENENQESNYTIKQQISLTLTQDLQSIQQISQQINQKQQIIQQNQQKSQSNQQIIISNQEIGQQNQINANITQDNQNNQILNQHFNQQINQKINQQSNQQIDQENLIAQQYNNSDFIENDEFQSIDNNYLQNILSTDCFFSISENKKVITDIKSYNQQEFQSFEDNMTLNNNLGNSNQENFITFGQNDLGNRKMYSVDFQFEDLNESKIQIKIMQNESALEIFKQNQIISLKDIKLRDYLSQLFQKDQIALYPNIINQESTKEYTIYKYRVFILISYLLILFGVTSNNFILIPIQLKLSQIYKCQIEDIYLINYLNIIMTSFFYLLLNFNQKIGKKELVIGSILSIIGSWLRVYQDYNFLLIGQILLGIGKPFIFFLQQNIVIYWFPPQERPLVYNLISANAVLSIIFQLINSQIYENEIENLFYFQAVLSTVLIVQAIFVYQNKPKILPSLQSEQLNSNQINFESLPLKQKIKIFFQKTKYLINFNLFLNFCCFCFQFSGMKMLIFFIGQFYKLNTQDLTINLIAIILMIYFSNTLLIPYIWSKIKLLILVILSITIVCLQNIWIKNNYLSFINVGIFFILPKLLQEQLQSYEIINRNFILGYFVFLGNIFSVIFAVLFQNSFTKLTEIQLQLYLAAFWMFSGIFIIFIKINTHQQIKIDNLKIIENKELRNEQFIYCF